MLHDFALKCIVMHMTVRVAVAGASGYAGGELLRLLLAHPDVAAGALDERMPVRDAAGVLLRPSTGTRNAAYVRLAPPLVITDEELNEGLDVITEGVKAL